MLAKLKGAVTGWIADQQQSGQKKSNLRGYADALGRMLMDMSLSPQEVAALQAQQRSLGLDQLSIMQIHRDAFTHVSRFVLEDGVVTAQELQALGDLGNTLGLGWRDLPLQHQRTYYIAHTCMQIQNGQLPSLPAGSTRIRESPGEVVHVEVTAQILDERVVSREFIGGSSGVSMRICKGVSYRFGSTRGRSIPVTAIVPVDQGVLSITSLRVAFMGTKKSFSVDWPKVLSAEPMSDGVHLTFQSRSKSALVQYLDLANAEVLNSLLGYYMS
ncbi:MAG: hypothetical protein ABL949_13605 [Fimbriimonadaceae bacterium]